MNLASPACKAAGRLLRMVWAGIAGCYRGLLYRYEPVDLGDLVRQPHTKRTNRLTGAVRMWEELPEHPNYRCVMIGKGD